MKIMYCIEGLYNSGGMERIVIAKANYFVSEGNDVTIVTVNQKDRPVFFKIDKSIKLIDLKINYDEISNDNIIKKIFSRHKKIKKHLTNLQEVVSIFCPDIIISTFGNEIEFLHKLNTPKNLKKIAEIHFSHDYRLMHGQNIIRRYIHKFLNIKYKNNISKLDAFVCLTEEDKQKWGNLNNLHVIPNFIEHKSNIPAQLNSNRAISMGRLTYQKGYDLLLYSWQKVALKHPDWILDIYGDGELKDELIKLREDLGLTNNVYFHSPIRNVYDVLHNASFYIMSSRFEGLPMVLLEAMSVGLPIVSFQCPCGPFDLLNDNNAGILVPPGNIDLLSKNITTLIEDKSLRIKMGESAYNEASKYLSKNVLEKWESLFKTLLNS